MGAVWFYHLTRGPVEETLPMLLEKALQAGWRVEVRSRDPARLDALDRTLWEVPADGFLPHARAGGPDDARQPVLLTAGGPAANGAACLMALDGVAVAPDEAAALERTCILFDGHDPAAVEAARAQWRTLTAAGLAAAYWAQSDSGGWTKRAEFSGAG